jgi:hypothetical protein
MIRSGLILLAMAAAFSQNGLTSSVSGQANAVLRGRVWVAEHPDVPVKRALVTVRTAGGSSRSTITDGDGAFSFLNLAAGSVSVTVSKPGSPSVDFGSRLANRSGTPIVLAAGKETFLNVLLPTGAVITGTIRGPSGEPVPDSPVWVMRAESAGVASIAATTMTDDRGVYRAYGLAAGDYVVATAIAGPSTGLMAVLGTAEIDAALAQLAGNAGTNVVNSPVVETHVTYAPMFYPGTAVSSSASVVSVMAGDERSGIDFVVDLVKTGTIEGTVGAPADVASGVYFRLLSERVFRLPGGSSVSATTSPTSFRVVGLPPGHYRVVVTARPGLGPPQAGVKQYGAFADVDLSSGVNVQRVHLELRPALTLSGRLEFKSSVLRRPTMSDIRLTLVEQDSWGQSALPEDATKFSRTVSTRGTADGTFAFDGIFPGAYTLLIEGQPQSWSLESAISDGVDLLDLPPRFTDTNLANTVVTFTDQPSSLSGRLVGESMPDFQMLSIVVFSADEALRTSPRRQRVVRPRTDGTFEVGELPSGRYLAAVVASTEAAALVSDRRSLVNLALESVAFNLEQGERKVLTLSGR